MFDSVLAVPNDGPSLGIPYVASEDVACYRLSSPAPGRSLGSTVTQAERPIRKAVRVLGGSVAIDDDAFATIFDCTVYGPNGFQESKVDRLAWFLINVVLTHAILTKSENVISFRLALEWFLGEERLCHKLLACFSRQQIKAAEIELSPLKVTTDLLDLLPYLIEPHGHITRNSLETCAIARKTRDSKKDDGVYYTPSDVVDFMVGSIASCSAENGSWIDPACGTGVFLRSVLAWHKNSLSNIANIDLVKFVLSSVFGIDKSALATDHTAFVLMIECALSTPNIYPVFGLWQQIKKNIVCMDALRLVPLGAKADLNCASHQLVEIGKIFPTVGCEGFDHVVMNPPYAKTRIDTGLKFNWHSFSDIPIGKFGDTHLAFSEMLWRFTSESSMSAAVLPLSVGTNTSKYYMRLRNELLRSEGMKEFLFFDREPQALFGEDIKTRNLILFRHATPRKRVVRTSRLLKWVAEKRPSIFHRSRLVTIEASQCSSFVPKLGSVPEKITYDELTSVGVLKSFTIAPMSTRVLLKDVVAADHAIHKNTLLIGSTAYNFINCFFPDGLPKKTARPYSSSPLNALVFNSDDDAYAAFALMSSRLCFWLWHVEGDGFHLTIDFLKRLPLWGIFSSDVAKSSLSKYGKILWQFTQKTAVGAVNGGKQTYSFHGGYDHPVAVKIEQVLVDHLHLSEDVPRWLDDFIQATVLINGKHRLRRLDSELKKVV